MFTAAPNVKHPAQLKADYHPIVNCVAQHPPVHDVNTGCVRYTYPIDAWPPKGSQITGAAALFAIMEFFVTTVLQALDDGHSTYLFTTLANRDIPADFGQWTQSKPELQVDLDWEHKRTVPGRGFFVPGRYRMYPKDETWTKGSLVCLDNNITF